MYRPIASRGALHFTRAHALSSILLIRYHCNDTNLNHEISIEPSIQIIKIRNKQSNLPFVDIYFLDQKHPHKYVSFLVDTGSTHSLIHESIFNNLPNHNYIETESTKANIRTASNQTLHSVKKAIIQFQLKDVNGHLHTFKHTFFIINSLNHDAYLGSDFLLNPIFCKAILNTSLMIATKNKKLAQIPFHFSNILAQSNSITNSKALESKALEKKSNINLKNNKFIIKKLIF